MRQKLGTNGVKINAAYLEQSYPWIAETYGMDQELDLIFEAVKPRVLFGPDSGSHVYLKSMLTTGVKLHGDMNYLVYDEFLLETEFDMEIAQEVVFARFKYVLLTPSGEPLERTVPLYNPQNMSESDYSQFWSYIDDWQDKML